MCNGNLNLRNQSVVGYAKEVEIVSILFTLGYILCRFRFWHCNSHNHWQWCHDRCKKSKEMHFSREGIIFYLYDRILFKLRNCDGIVKERAVDGWICSLYIRKFSGFILKISLLYSHVKIPVAITSLQSQVLKLDHLPSGPILRACGSRDTRWRRPLLPYQKRAVKGAARY
jgi:hypothetical protein